MLPARPVTSRVKPAGQRPTNNEAGMSPSHTGWAPTHKRVGGTPVAKQPIQTVAHPVVAGNRTKNQTAHCASKRATYPPPTLTPANTDWRPPALEMKAKVNSLPPTHRLPADMVNSALRPPSSNQRDLAQNVPTNRKTDSIFHNARSANPHLLLRVAYTPCEACCHTAQNCNQPIAYARP